MNAAFHTMTDRELRDAIDAAVVAYVRRMAEVAHQIGLSVCRVPHDLFVRWWMSALRPEPLHPYAPIVLVQPTSLGCIEVRGFLE